MSKDEERIIEKKDIMYATDPNEMVVFLNPRTDNEFTLKHVARILLRPRVCGCLTMNADCVITSLSCDATKCPVKDEELLGEMENKTWSLFENFFQAFEEIGEYRADFLSEEQKKQMASSWTKDSEDVSES